MATTAARRTVVAPDQLALPFLLPEPPAVVDGIAGQLDLVAAVHEADAAADRLARQLAAAQQAKAPASAVRMAAEISARIGVPLRALPDGAITNAPYPATAAERAEFARLTA
jgi:hypothetical protein